MIKIVSDRGIVEIIALFAVVMLFGFAIANAAIATSRVSVIDSGLASPQFTYFAYFLDAVIFGVLILIVLRRHHSKTFFFRVLEFVVIGFTSFFAFLVVYTILLPQHGGYVVALPGHITYAIALPQSLESVGAYVLAVVSALALVAFKELHPRAKDLATMVSSIGVGLLLGISFSFLYAMIILAIVALYDYITIFMTKVMVRMDRALIAMDISFLISVSDIEAISHGTFSRKEEKRYEKYLIRTHQADDPRFKKILEEHKLPVVSQISLGEGDLSLPLMAAISAYYSYVSYAFTGIIMLGAILGVVVTMLLLRKYKKPLPAIPPFFGFISIAAALAYLYTGKGIGYESIVFMVAGIIIMLLTVRYLSKEVAVEGGSRKAGNGKKSS